MSTHIPGPDGDTSAQQPRSRPSKRRKTRPRTCYICRGETWPKDEEQSTLDKLRGKPPRQVYHDDECGRMISPCNCKGSMKHVHEGCLQEWRYSQAGTDNSYRCRTCQYEYKFERMEWARRARSPVLAFLLAIVIVIVCVFLLGFVGDHVLNLYLDPVGTIAEGIGLAEHEADEEFHVADMNIDEDGWASHFLKGLLSLGLLGFVKAFLAMSPWQWWNLRTTGLVGTGRRGGGRDRMENLSMTVVIIGAFTFFWAVWTGTRKWTQHTLDKTSERILNVQPDDDDDESDDEHEAGSDAQGSAAPVGTEESRKDQ